MALRFALFRLLPFFFFLVCGKKTASFKVAVAEMKSHFTFRSFHFVPPSFGTWGDRKFHPFLFWLSFFFIRLREKWKEKEERERWSERTRVKERDEGIGEEGSFATGECVTR